MERTDREPRTNGQRIRPDAGTSDVGRPRHTNVLFISHELSTDPPVRMTVLSQLAHYPGYPVAPTQRLGWSAGAPYHTWGGVRGERYVSQE